MELLSVFLYEDRRLFFFYLYFSRHKLVVLIFFIYFRGKIKELITNYKQEI